MRAGHGLGVEELLQSRAWPAGHRRPLRAPSRSCPATGPRPRASRHRVEKPPRPSRCRSRDRAWSRCVTARPPRVAAASSSTAGAAILEPLQQRLIEACRLLIEQAADIDSSHCRHARAGAEIERAAAERRDNPPDRRRAPSPGGDRPVAVAEIVADRAEREPGGGEAGRKLHRLPAGFRQPRQDRRARHDRARDS